MHIYDYAAFTIRSDALNMQRMSVLVPGSLVRKVT